MRCRKLKAKVFRFWRELTMKCDYANEDESCDKCRKAGASCGRKVLANKVQDETYRGNSRTHAERESTLEAEAGCEPSWSLDEPILPRLFKQFDDNAETKQRILDVLYSELCHIQSLGMWNPRYPSPLNLGRENILGRNVQSLSLPQQHTDPPSNLPLAATRLPQPTPSPSIRSEQRLVNPMLRTLDPLLEAADLLALESRDRTVF